jgi:hypothetical protein
MHLPGSLHPARIGTVQVPRRLELSIVQVGDECATCCMAVVRGAASLETRSAARQRAWLRDLFERHVGSGFVRLW